MLAVAIVGLETIKGKDGNPKFSTTFANNIETWKHDHPKADLRILDARKYKDLPDPMLALWNDLKALEAIDTLIYSGHSDNEVLYVVSRFRQELSDYQRFIDNSTDWDGVKFSPKAEIYLTGCQAGGRDGVKFDICIAQDIANKTGIKVFAYTWKSSQQRRKDGRWYQKPDRGGFVEFNRAC